MHSCQLSQIHQEAPGICSFYQKSLTDLELWSISLGFLKDNPENTHISPGLLKDNPENNFMQVYLSISLSFRMK